MDPLINLPETAKACIKAGEARAQEQFIHVRRAFEQDVANANAQWGGYLDLHQDELRSAIQEAHEGLEEASRLHAQWIFALHAKEHQKLLGDPLALAPVLERTREAVIKQFGERVRLAVQSLESQKMAEAWNCPRRANSVGSNDSPSNPGTEGMCEQLSGASESRPLGDNPFQSEHPAHEAFEEATWGAKRDLQRVKSIFKTR